MKPEDKELLLKDLCARLPYGVFCNIGLDYPYSNGWLTISGKRMLWTGNLILLTLTRLKIKDMKAYTDLEQSKKLTEILPPESADMFWADGERPAVWNNKDISLDEMDIPCWSLAALLEVLPTIDDGNRNPVVCKDIRLNKWHVVYHGTAVEPTIDSEVYDDLIDAAVEMILKLHEQKLI